MTRQRVLVVDDDDSIRWVVRRTLEQLGLEVLDLDDGAGAPEMLARSPVDLLVIDLYMPGMNGFELLRRVRQPEQGVLAASGTLSRVPVLVISGESHTASIKNAKALGASAYLTKPVDVDELIAAVEQLLQRG